MELREIMIAIGCSVIGFLASWAFQKIEKNGEKRADGFEQKLEKNTEAHILLSLSMVELKSEVKNLTEKLSPIPKMQSDLAHLHGLRRELKLKANTEDE